MSIAVVILNYNSAVDCKKCIEDLMHQRNVDLQVIVVDNASHTDDLQKLREICEEYQVCLLENKVNNGYSAGNNIGLRYAVECKCDLALIANPDMEFPDHDYLRTLSGKFSDNEDVAVVASDILHHEGWHQNPFPMDNGWRSAFFWWRFNWKKPRRSSAEGWNTSGVCGKVSGCCFMIRMDFLRQIGFFDEYPFLYCEEAILAAQVKAAGKKMFYLAEKQAIHRHIVGEKGNPIPKIKQFFRSRKYYHWRYTSDNIILKSIATASWFLWCWRLIMVWYVKYGINWLVGVCK